MQITQKQLDTQLTQSLSPLYLISGDVPLLVQETRENIFSAARSRGFSDKETCHINSSFQIDSLIKSLKNIGLFDQKKIIDIRNPSAKFDGELIKALTDHLTHPVDDRIIIISTEKLTPAQQKSAWFELFRKSAVFVSIWPIAIDTLPQWIIERAKKLTLTMPIDVAKLLATFTEGNLLATQQALEKLQLLHPNAEITRDLLLTVLSDHAHFSIFDLSDAIARSNQNPRVSKEIYRITRILSQLELRSEEPVLVLWSICRKIRDMMASSSQNPRVSKEIYKRAIQHAATVDEIIKGAKPGDSWQALLQLCLMV